MSGEDEFFAESHLAQKSVPPNLKSPLSLLDSIFHHFPSKTFLYKEIFASFVFEFSCLLR